MIPEGLCQCGCGQPTRVANQDDRRYGNVKGLPRRFVKGHDKRLDRVQHGNGYILVHAPNHPKAIQGKVSEHVIVAERAVGHVLPNGTVVHHVSDQKADNQPSNLVVLQNQGEHVGLHTRRAVLRAGGDPWTQRLCCVCKQPKSTQDFYRLRDRAFSAICKPCSRTRATARQRRLKAQNEIAAAGDADLRVAGGTVEIVLPPYQAA